MIEVAAFMTTMNFFASADTSAGGQRIRREREAGEDVGVIAHDQFLREPLGDVGRNAADIFADEFDLLAGDGVAVLLHVELDGVVHLRGGVGELAGIRDDDADLDGVLRIGRTDCAKRQRRAGNPVQECLQFRKNFCMCVPPVLGFFPLCSAPISQC